MLEVVMAKRGEPHREPPVDQTTKINNIFLHRKASLTRAIRDSEWLGLIINILALVGGNVSVQVTH